MTTDRTTTPTRSNRPGSWASPARRAAALTVAATSALAGLAATVGGCAIQKLDENELLSRTYAEGNEAYLRGDYQTALAEFQAILTERPQSPTANHDVGRTLLALGRPGEGIEPLAVAHELRPNDADILEDYITALTQAGRSAELLIVLERLSAERGDAASTVVAARAAAELGLVDDAERALLAVIRQTEDQSAAPRLALAEIYERAGDRDRAIDQLRIALWLEPDNAEIQGAVRALGEIPGPTFQRAPRTHDAP